MAKENAVILVVSLRWWVRYYLLGIALCAAVTGADPDWSKVQVWIRRGVVVRVQGEGRGKLFFA